MVFFVKSAKLASQLTGAIRRVCNSFDDRPEVIAQQQAWELDEAEPGEVVAVLIVRLPSATRLNQLEALVGALGASVEATV